MEQTQGSNSVPVNNLANLLKKSRSIMNKVETGDYETGNVDSRLISEDRMKEAVDSRDEPPTRRIPKMKSDGTMNSPVITEESIKKSKLPDAIKKLMLDKPIPQATFTNTFSLEDVNGLIDDEKYEKPLTNKGVVPKKKAVQPNVIKETYTQRTGDGLTEADIREIVNEQMIKFLSTYFTKSLTEQVEKKVINQLLESGKIRVKK